MDLAGTRVLMIETPIFAHFVKNMVRRTSFDLEVVGAVVNAGDALELIRTYQPDILIIDLQSSFQDGLNILMKICSAYPNAQIIGRIKNTSYEFIIQAISAGVKGFINDQTPFSELVKAIQTVKQGYAFLPNNIANQFVTGLHQYPIVR